MTVDKIIDELESCDFYGNVGDISFCIATEDDDGEVLELADVLELRTRAPCASAGAGGGGPGRQCLRLFSV